MITVQININGNCIMARSAVNVKTNKDGSCDYKVDDGNIINHHPKDGAVKLSKKLLETIKEVKDNEIISE